MTPFWGTESFALGTKVGAHVGRQDGPNMGARSPFCESAFRGAGAGGNAGSHPPLVWVLGCGVGWGNGVGQFRMEHFQGKLGSHPWVGQQCVSLLQSPFGPGQGIGGRRVAASRPVQSARKAAGAEIHLSF